MSLYWQCCTHAPVHNRRVAVLVIPYPCDLDVFMVSGVCDRQFYLTEADLGKPRAAACVAKLAELNRYVAVRK